MTDLALFDLEPAPVVESDWTPIALASFDGDDSTKPKAERKAAWKAYLAGWRCRDCGSPSKLNSGGSMPDRTGFYVLCDACAAIDACRDRNGDGTHVSGFGDPHTPAQHHERVRARERRRASYRKSHSSGATS